MTLYELRYVLSQYKRVTPILQEPLTDQNATDQLWASTIDSNFKTLAPLLAEALLVLWKLHPIEVERVWHDVLNLSIDEEF